MGKVIFWLVVFFVVLLALRLVNVANGRARNRDAARRRPKAKDGAMIRCVDCGVYLPSADAIQGPRGPLCGDPQCAHRRAGGGG
ncbi:MAG TPA: PP0621 family protein [Burkholderiales bacterium]|nr:PP0621 family protein [Burkholderiales bacterium]